MKSEFEKFIIKPNMVDQLLKNNGVNHLSYRALSSLNAIYNVVSNDLKLKIKKHRINDWHLFENNEIDYSEDFFYTLFVNDAPLNDTAILFTLEGLISKQCAFKFQVSDFFRFSSLYEEYFSMEFFQISYYSIYLTKSKICRYLDEDGVIHEVNFSPGRADRTHQNLKI